MKPDGAIALSLFPAMFGEAERELLRSPDYEVSAFRYRSGVEAIRVRAGRGELVWLPYLGQQIWDWSVDGKSQKFEGFVQEPAYGRDFLHNYGAFLLHCGMTAMGNPGPNDKHLHHGELPVSRFDEAWIELGGEGRGASLSLRGRLHWRVPIVAEYLCEPSVALSPDGLSLSAEVGLENPCRRPLEYMYLAHINFPISGAERILSTAPFDAKHVRLREELVPGSAARPESIKLISQDACYEPELVAIADDRDAPGARVGSVLRCADGSCRWVRQESPELDHHVLWLTRAADRGACGFHLPSTAGPRGLESERALGSVKSLPPGERVSLRFSCGYCGRAEDAPVEGAV